MNPYNFNHWYARRDNNINELFDWLFKKKQGNVPPEQQTPLSPDEIDKSIYKNDSVNKYVDIILKHLGLSAGTTLQQIDPQSGSAVQDITITNLQTQYPNFYSALQRFVAGHVVGGGTERSFMRISQHDAIAIINFLDHVRKPGDKNSVAEEMHIGDLESLSSWMQTKLPMSHQAVLQQGFGQAQSDFLSSRVARGKGNPLGHPTVKGLVSAGEEVVRQGLVKRHYTIQLHSALKRLNAELVKITNTPVDPIKPKSRSGTNPSTGTPGKAGPP